MDHARGPALRAVAGGDPPGAARAIGPAGRSGPAAELGGAAWPRGAGLGARASQRTREEELTLALIPVLALCAFLTQYIFRGLDDNRLTSWSWMIGEGDVGRIGLVLVLGLALAYGLARVWPMEHHPVAVLSTSTLLVALAFWREPEVIVDAARYFTQAKYLAVHGPWEFLGAWGKEIPVWTDLPLVPFLYGVLFSVAGETRVVIQAFTTLLFSGTAVLTYLLGRRLWDETVGFFAAALLLGMPYLLTQVPLMLVDVPTMFFVTLAIYTATEALARGGAGWVAGAAVAVALAGLSKYSAWPLLTGLLVIVLVQGRKGREERRLTLWRAAMILLGAGLLAAPAVLYKWDVVVGQLGLLYDYQLPGLARWRESFAGTFLFQVHPFIAAAAIWSVALALRARDATYAIVAWPVLVLVLLGIERARYLVVVLPMVALMASYGLRVVPGAATRRCAASCIVASSLAVGAFGYLPGLMETSAVNVKRAGEYLDSLGGEAVEVFALPQVEAGINPAVTVPLLDFFTSKRVVYRHEPTWSPLPDGVEQSPLRFTWELGSPGFYGAGSGRSAVRPAAVAVISSHRGQELPGTLGRILEGYSLGKSFETADPWFQYQTVVRVYRPVQQAPPGEGS